MRACIFVLIPSAHLLIKGECSVNFIVIFNYNQLNNSSLSSDLARYRSKILAAMKHIESKSCVQFKQRTNQANYVQFFSGDGYQSFYHYALLYCLLGFSIISEKNYLKIL